MSLTGTKRKIKTFTYSLTRCCVQSVCACVCNMCMHILSYTIKSEWKKVEVKLKSCPTLFELWTVAGQAPPFMGFARQELKSLPVLTQLLSLIPVPWKKWWISKLVWNSNNRKRQIAFAMDINCSRTPEVKELWLLFFLSSK